MTLHRNYLANIYLSHEYVMRLYLPKYYLSSEKINGEISLGDRSKMLLSITHVSSK